MSDVSKELASISTMIKELEILEFPNKEMYINQLKKWLINSTERNLKIKRNQSTEKVHKKRQNVYCLDYGVNIGSELNFFHFCVVIKEFDYTSIVVPLSTEKEDDAEWKNAGNLIIPIGEIEDMPKNKKPVYAMVNQIRTVSKQRLTDYYDSHERKYYPMTLDENQMQIILDTIGKLTTQTIKKKQNSDKSIDVK